jgi:acylaminoacyl-peptidase
MCLVLFWLVIGMDALRAEASHRFEFMDVFRMEFASDPQISPDGKRIVYVRNFMDIQKDRRRSSLWIINVDGSDPRALTRGDGNERMPRWSVDSKRLLYLSGSDGPELMCRWMDSGDVGRLAQLPAEPTGISWSGDGRMIAFTMHVAETPKPFVQLPAPPKGAQWADPPRMIRSLNYRFDGKGYLKEGYHHLFVLPADGGTPRQVTHGSHDHVGTPAWTPDGASLLIAANRHAEGDQGDHQPQRAGQHPDGFAGWPANRIHGLRRQTPRLPGDQTLHLESWRRGAAPAHQYLGSRCEEPRLDQAGHASLSVLL